MYENLVHCHKASSRMELKCNGIGNHNFGLVLNIILIVITQINFDDLYLFEHASGIHFVVY